RRLVGSPVRPRRPRRGDARCEEARPLSDRAWCARACAAVPGPRARHRRTTRRARRARASRPRARRVARRRASRADEPQAERQPAPAPRWAVHRQPVAAREPRPHRACGTRSLARDRREFPALAAPPLPAGPAVSRRKGNGSGVDGNASTQRLVAVFGAACLLFNFPLLGVWDSGASVFGLPLLPVAIFAVWAVLIGL